MSWFDGYLQQTVRHILEHSGIEVTARHLKVCRNVPVLAVFMSYLHGAGRQLELQSLLEEEHFARWIVKRLQLGFPGMSVSNLAQVVTLLPMPSNAVHHPDLKEHGPLFDILATDGWIEKFPADEEYKAETWRAAHDVFADQILLFHFDSIPHTVEYFVRHILSLARRVGCLRSALTTLQRLVDRPALRALDWPEILDTAIAEDPPAWRDVRDLLVRTPLLTYTQIISLLGRHEEVWRGAEAEPAFQSRIGWLARRALEQGDELNDSQRSILESWLQKSAAHATVGNYVLTSGVKFCPELVRDAALNWILTRPRVFQTHYLMVAWLEQGLPTEDIARAVEQWSAKFSVSPHLSYIARAWLDAEGDKELLRTSIRTWLAAHGTLAQAQFVYQAWLNAGGDIEFVRESVAAWLAAHKADTQAQFVYKSWLDAGGDIEFVRESVAAWLAAHAALAEAGFVYRAWLDAGGGAEQVRESVAAWLAAHAALAEAQFVYKSWLDAGGDIEFVREPSPRGWPRTPRSPRHSSSIGRGSTQAAARNR